MKSNKELEKELIRLKKEKVDYGLKELIHGILIGIIIGFGLAWFLLK